MRYRRLVRIILCSSLLLFAAQFAVFRARSVFDLARTLREGSLDELEHPEKVPDDPFAREREEAEEEVGRLPGAKPQPKPAEKPEKENLPAILLGEELQRDTGWARAFVPERGSLR